MPGACLVRRIARILACRRASLALIALLAVALSAATSPLLSSAAAARSPDAETAAVPAPDATSESAPTPAAEAPPPEPARAPDAAPPSETASKTVPPEPAPDEPALLPRTASLVAVLTARRQTQAELRELQAELRSEAARGRESQIERQIHARAADLTSLARSFSELATGVDPASLESAPEPVQFELAHEIRVLLTPLVNELKRATSRPREIDRLRTDIAELESDLQMIEKALAQLDEVAEASQDAELDHALEAERSDWLRRRAALETTLEVSRQKLAQRTTESRSVAEAVQDIFQVFFKSRGRNLLIAFAAMAGFFFVLHRLRSLLSKQERFALFEQTFGGRVFGLVYAALTFLGAVVVFVVALYLAGDWVLLILALLLILGLVWASKQALPRYWSQAVLILDMGAVRQGQRVWLNGLPWRVESIGFYCVLVNPALVGGRIRIPIEDLGKLRSRADQPDEPFFPTRQGDVVLIDKGRPALVEFQSIEVVRLRSPGGNTTILPTEQFASQSHEVLSNGYRVDLQFGIDYENQAGITTTTRELFEVEVLRRWRETEWARSLVSGAVEFSAAGPSSLDYFVRVDLDGSQAMEYAAQRRHLAGICVDVCNQNGWVIPFQQMTVHLAPPEQEQIHG